MNTRIVSLVIALLVPATAAADPAAPIQECVGMNAYAPGKTFPLNTEQPIYLSLSGPAGAFDDYEQPEVFVEVDGVYQPVEFSVTAASNGASQARDLELTSPQPGAHIVTWGGGDCDGTPSPVDATKIIIGSFEVLEAAELPTALGEFTSVDTRPEGGRDPYWSADFVVDLDTSAIPWQHVMEFGVEIDGSLESPFTVGLADGGTLSETYLHWCETSDVQPGVHQAVIVGRVQGTEVRTEPVEIDIECLPPEKGCSVGAVGSGTWLGVLMMLGVVGLRRRRRD